MVVIIVFILAPSFSLSTPHIGDIRLVGFQPRMAPGPCV